MKRVYLRVFTCTLSVVLLYPAFAVVSQTNTGSLSGMVTDVMGAAVPKAKVWAIRKSDQRVTFETTTDDSGKFIFTNLPPDVYQVTVGREDTKNGSATEQFVTVSPGRMAQLEIRFGSGCENVPEGNDEVSDADKAEVFRAMLMQATTPQWGVLDPKQREVGVILSTKNIKGDWLQGFEGVSIQLWTPADIQRKADDEADFLYLWIPEMKVRGQCIAVTLSNTWAVGKDSKSAYMSGGGLTYEYRKESGKWVGKFITGWVL